MVDFTFNGDADDLADAIRDGEERLDAEADLSMRVLKEWSVKWTNGREMRVRGHDMWPDEGRIWVSWVGVGITWSGLSAAVESVFLIDPLLSDVEEED